MILTNRTLMKCVLELLILLFFVFDSDPDRYKTQEICDRAVHNYASAIKYVPDQFKNQEMCDKAVYDNPNALKFVPDRYKTPEMYGKAVYDFLPTFHFFPDCFVTSKMIKKLFTFFCMQIQIYSISMKILVMLHLIKMKWIFLM